MRKKTSRDGLTVQAISGTYVILLGFDLDRNMCPGLLGFSIHRTDQEGNTAEYLRGMKCFEDTDPGFPSGSSYSTRDHPVQSFGWSDYTVQPGRRYSYVVTALRGAPAALEGFAHVSITITTESPEGGDHDVYFNSGVAGSQAYIRRFGYRPPNLVENNAAFDWLSRGLYEAMRGFVERATDDSFELRVAAYEFNYEPFLICLAQAKARGVTLRIVYDRRKEKPGDGNERAVEAAGLAVNSKKRTENKSYISHNKFIVLIKNGEPLAVWTGGTNFSEGGIFGHSNVAHVVEDPAVARFYAAYWDLLADNPTNDELEPLVEALSPVPAAGNTAEMGTTVVFSPRPSLRALEWYRDLAMRARHGLFMTFAFGINDIFKDVYRTSAAPLRFALLEKKTRTFKRSEEQLRIAEERAIDRLRFDKANVFAIGSIVRDGALEGWVKERLTGLNKNVNYVHNKFMLIDPLSRNPIVIAGSANFSNASTTNNDENMLVVKGNRRVADIYLGEFMRLYSHHAFRESVTFRNAAPPKFLRTDDWWTDYFGDTPRSRRRTYFAGVPFEPQA